MSQQQPAEMHKSITSVEQISRRNVVSFNEGQTVESYHRSFFTLKTTAVQRFGPSGGGEIDTSSSNVLLRVTADFTNDGEKKRRTIVLPLMPTLANSLVEVCPNLEGTRAHFKNPKRILLSASDEISVGYDISSTGEANSVLIVKHAAYGEAELTGDETKIEGVYDAIQNTVYQIEIKKKG